ncbi:MAG: MOSC domain-containing protein [Caldilineaceae bacterium]|nr:MOSC domain-containing protein [Caldilineaceae bacterium]HRJ43695.1 MOSC domain-containing protein [Caldilineaceae bacterium]
MKIAIHSIYIGQPQTINDPSGIWRSSIFREMVEGPVALTRQGLAGDQVTDTDNHGRLGYQQVCCHSMDHYTYWNERLGLRLGPGNVGENWTLENADEAAICLEDIYRVGTATVQVSIPRVPCSKQAKRIGRSDWTKLTIDELRTGFYLRVLEEGFVQAGDEWELVERKYPWATVYALNELSYRGGEQALAEQFLSIPNFHPSAVVRMKRLIQERTGVL